MFFIALIMLSFAKPPADLKSITYLLSSPPAFWYNSSPYFDFIAGSTPLVPPIFRNPPLTCFIAPLTLDSVGICWWTSLDKLFELKNRKQSRLRPAERGNGAIKHVSGGLRNIGGT